MRAAGKPAACSITPADERAYPQSTSTLRIDMASDPGRFNGPQLDLNSLDNLYIDNKSRAAVATDFGKIVRREPQGVLRPRSMEDVAAAFRYCRNRDIEI